MWLVYLHSVSEEREKNDRCLPKQTISLVSIVPDSPIFTTSVLFYFFLKRQVSFLE